MNTSSSQPLENKLSIWISGSFFSYFFHLENLDNYSASTWHQQNWWNICNKKHHTRPMATTSNQSICLPFSILFHFSHSFPVFFTFPLRENMLIILLVSDIPDHDGIFSQKQTRWLLDPANLNKTNFPFGYPVPLFSFLFHLENLDNYSASTWHQQNWWIICNKKHHTRPRPPHRTNLFVYMDTLFHPFPFFSILFHLSSYLTSPITME